MQLRHTSRSMLFSMSLAFALSACTDSGKPSGHPSVGGGGDDGDGHVEPPETEDLSVPGVDLAAGDLSAPADLAVPDHGVPVDFSVPHDMAVPDLAVVDLAVPDLLPPPDLLPLDVDGALCTGCGGTCGLGVTTPFYGPTPPAGWSFNKLPSAAGGAFYDATNNVAVLTDDGYSYGGSLFYMRPIVIDTFDLRFQFRISHVGGQHADGMAFALVKDDATVSNIYTATGIAGSGLGIVSATASGSTRTLGGYALELDTYDNDNPNSYCGESVRGDHINIDTLTPCTLGSGGKAPTPVGTTQAYTLVDGVWHTVTVHFEAGAMTVTIEPEGGVATTPFTNVALPNFVSGDAYWFGFTASTGGYSERHEVRNVSFSFPTPRCL